MSKFLYPIKNLEIMPWIKHWLLKRGSTPSYPLSEIIIGASPLTLINSVRKKFNIFNISGNTIQDGTPTPESPIPVENVSGEVEVKVENKNLFDESIMKDYTYNVKYEPILVKPNTNYTLSTNSGSSVAAMVFLSTDTTNVTTANNGAWLNNPRTINSGNNTIMYIGYRNDLRTYWIQLEEGSTATSYEPHEEQTATLSLPEGMEMCKIGTYQDSFVYQGGKWYKNKVIEKLVLNGSEDWATKSTVNSKRRITLPVTLTAASGSTLNVICNQLLYKTSTQVYLENEGISIGSEISLYVNEYSTETTPTSWKAHLSSSNLLVYYALATPVLEEITDATLTSDLENLKNLYSYKGVTYISSTNEPSPVFEVQYYMEGE